VIKNIIFTQHNILVYHISNTFLISLVNHKTGKEERQSTMKEFREARYNAIVISKVLDGVDVLDAELSIITSGTTIRRKFIQRFGRLLIRKSDVNKKAKLRDFIHRRRKIYTSTLAQNEVPLLRRCD
jgi:superfamily II DNA or RNA helicase